MVLINKNIFWSIYTDKIFLNLIIFQKVLIKAMRFVEIIIINDIYLLFYLIKYIQYV